MILNSKNYFISDKAFVAKGVTIGEGTSIWDKATVRKGVKIGKNCNIAEGVTLEDGVIIGDNVRIANNANLYKGVVIKDNVRIGAGTCFTNNRKVSPFKKADRYLDTIVDEGVVIGANATIVGGITIGTKVTIADGCVVVGNVPANHFVNGNPGRAKRKI